MSQDMGRAIGLNENKIRELSVGALIHDVGKLYISENILSKPSKLTIEEYSEVKDHTILGCYSDLADCLNNSRIREIVKFHHERYDGSGYPAGLKGEQIPLYARIVAVADCFDAMVDLRGYNKPKSLNQALQEIISFTEIQFDPEIVSAFESIYDNVIELYNQDEKAKEKSKKR